MPKDFYEGIKLIKNFDKKLVEKAFKFAQKAHKGQKRKSGDEYITHPVAVAKILLSLGMNAQMVTAALLHDAVEDTEVTVEDIKKEFGEDVAMLVSGVTNLGKIDFSAYSSDEEIAEAQRNLKNENLKQLFLAMAEDARVVVIKLADRLHNMQTIKALHKEDQFRIARETLNIFSPLALRLGMGEIKGKLEDLAFPIAYPEEYSKLKKEANRRYKTADRYVLHVKRLIADKLEEEKVRAEIDGRSKHLYSLYKKMQRPEINWDFDKVYDLVALRIVTNTIPDCYRILGIIHGMYRPVPDYIRDYIAAPKPNGYRSIHTSVFGPEGKVVEIQIRTHEMHEEAEFGVASHMHYVEAKTKGVSDTDLETKFVSGKKDQVQFLKKIKEWQEGRGVEEDFAEGLKIEFLDDRIYVFSPKGDIYDLPTGATPVDFAYEVHSRIGDTCRGAKVNGKIVSLNIKLKTRDIVEIITAKESKPNRAWLDFVKTAKAKQHIRSFFRRFDFEKNQEEGRKIVEDELAMLGMKLEDISAADLKSALSETSFREAIDIFASVGEGLTTPRQALKMILGRSFIPEAEKRAVKVIQKVQNSSKTDLKATPAPCCNPGRTDRIICYITRGRGLTAHKKGCKNLKSLEADRLVEYNPWQKSIEKNIEILAQNKVGLLRDITEIISKNDINIERIHNKHVLKGEKTKINIVVSVEDIAKIADLVEAISLVKNVEEVRVIK